MAGTRLEGANSWVLAVAEAGTETIALAEGFGLDPGLFFKAIEGSTLDLPYLRMKGRAMAGRDFPRPSGCRLPRRTRGSSPAPRETTALTCQSSRRSRGASSKGPRHGDEDFSATYLTSAV